MARGTLCPRRVMRTGLFVVAGAGERVLPLPDDGFLLTTREAAKLIGVEASTIRQWRKRGQLVPQGLDERGYPLHSPQAVRDAEKKVRKRGLDSSNIDPRLLRKSASRLGSVA
jgi:hypothetical protein